MKINESQRVDFVSGQNVPPEDINAVLLYATDALADVATKRFTRGVVVLPYVVDVGTAYDQTMTGTEELTYRFTCPNTCVIERAFLSANMTSAAEVQWAIVKASDSSVPTGATSPWLSTKGAIVDGAVSADGIIASATSLVTDAALDRVLLVAGTEYKISVSCSGNFSLQRADLTLVTITDRWTPSGTTSVPSFAPTLLHVGDVDDVGVNLQDDIANLEFATGSLATHLTAPAPMFFVKHGLLSSTDSDICTFAVPQQASSRAQMSVVKIYVYVLAAGACTVTGTLKDSGGTTVASVEVACSGAGFFSSGTIKSGALPAALAGSGGSPAVTGKDYTFDFTNSSGANTGTKVYAFVWVSRG